MSYNIRLDMASDGENRWDARKDKVASLMKYNGADFIGGQEVQYHQLNYLLKKLEQYCYIGVGRDDGKEGGEYSCIFFKKEKFELLASGTFWLSPTPGVPSKGWDAAYNRICTYGLFKRKASKLKFWIFNTHLDHIGQVARLESVKLIHQKILELNAGNYPALLCGDFNSRPTEAPAIYMYEAMINTREVSSIVNGQVDTWNGFKFHEKPDGCIDYIFISKDKNISVTKFSTLTDSYDLKYPSDHFPVMATMILHKK